MQLISDIIKNKYSGSVCECEKQTGVFTAQLYRWIKMGAVKSDLNDNVYRKYEDGAIQDYGEYHVMPVYVKIGTFHKENKS